MSADCEAGKAVTRIIHNVYCDESCHLRNENVPIMAFGGLCIPGSAVRPVSKEIRAIKAAHGCREISEKQAKGAGIAPTA